MSAIRQESGVMEVNALLENFSKRFESILEQLSKLSDDRKSDYSEILLMLGALNRIASTAQRENRKLSSDEVSSIKEKVKTLNDDLHALVKKDRSLSAIDAIDREFTHINSIISTIDQLLAKSERKKGKKAAQRQKRHAGVVDQSTLEALQKYSIHTTQTTSTTLEDLPKGLPVVPSPMYN